MAATSPSSALAPLYLFGASQPWHTGKWRTTDDRLRGGSSHSTLTATDNADNGVLFSGNLDVSTLGGAGFASQLSPLDRSSASAPAGVLTVGDDDDDDDDDDDGTIKASTTDSSSSSSTSSSWNLTRYAGIGVAFAHGDGKVYTLILKDQVPAVGQQRRAGISWEATFSADGDGVAWLSWADFRAMYRGREVGGEGLDKGAVTRVGLMMRSFFGGQEGRFGVEIRWVCAWRVGEGEL